MISKKNISRLAYLVLVLAISICAAAIDQSNSLKRLDNLFYDLLIASQSRPPDSRIAIIAIDEKSIEQLGRWPWPREIHTNLLLQLAKLDHPATGIDIMFSEHDESNDADMNLARAIHAHGRVVLPIVPVSNIETSSVSERHPIDILEQAANRLGSVDAELDEDGISRSIYLLGGLGTALWPSFPLAMLSIENPAIEDNLPGARSPLQENDDKSHWARNHHVHVPFTGPPGHYPAFSYVDVLEGRTKPSELEGKYLFVGVTATGIGDRLPTPTTGHSYQMSGVEYMANVLDAISNKTLISIVNNRYRAYFTIIAVLLPLLLYPLLSIRLSLATWIISSLSILFFSSALLLSGLWLPPATALVFTLTAFPIWTWSRLKISSRMLTEADDKRSAEMNAVDHGVIILDTDLRIEYMNELAQHMTNIRMVDVTSQPLQSVIPDLNISQKNPDPGIETTNVLALSIADQVVIENATGNQAEIYIHNNPFSDRWGNSRGYVINLSYEPVRSSENTNDTTERYQDKLTGLHDRTAISLLISQFIKQDNGDSDLYILNMDIDNLALITSSMTHEIADRVVVKFVHRLQSILSTEYTLGRLGSDQLVLIMTQAEVKHVKEVAAQIINQAKRPITHDSGQIILAVNIGISHYPTDGDDAETLLKHASFAIRQNESMARSGYKFYSRKDHELSMQDHNLEQNLRQSIRDNSLELYYQPQIELKSGEIIGFEALLRWKDENNQFVSTDKAITIAEQSELIHQLGRWVVHTACKQIQHWQQSLVPVRRFSINLSPADLEQQDFLKYTTNEIHARSIDPSQLELEITEHSVLKNTDLSMQVLNAFNDMGARLAIDDFGTGYSTFNYLKSLPVSTVKIDKSFVQNMVEIEDDAFIVLSIISMAHGLGIDVVAEGIETESQMKMLLKQGCDIAQGYLISRPMPASEVQKWLNEKCKEVDRLYYLHEFSKWV